MSEKSRQFASRSGQKLAAALDAFGVDVRGWRCLDFGAHTGGFVDCLLQRGAATVTAIDPGEGVLAAHLRSDPRVCVCEGVNALDYQTDTPADLITSDVGWTPQRLILPAARRNLGSGGRVITLVKPQYEAPPRELRGGVVPADRIDAVLEAVREDVEDDGWRILGTTESPLQGHGGNREFLWLLVKAGAAQ